MLARHKDSILIIFAIGIILLSSMHANAELNDTSWQLIEFQSMDDSIGTIKPRADSLYTMHFYSDGSAHMQLNCNRANGRWIAESGPDSNSGRFSLGPLAATRALCQPPSMDENILRDAEYIRSYLLKDDRLYLSLMADGGIYAWESIDEEKGAKLPHVSPEKGGPRNWQVSGVSTYLNLRESPSLSSSIIGRYSEGVLLDNLGCKKRKDHIWCDVQQLGGGARGYVASEFLVPAISPDGSVATGIDDSSLRAGQGDFDAAGKIPCRQYSGQSMVQCDFSVARAGGGYATVVISRPDGYKRVIFFRMGRPIGASTSEADGYPPFKTSKEKDLNSIHVGDELYEIPDAVVMGG
jgi:hypothetical protein